MFHYGIEELVLVRTPPEALEFRAKDSSYLVAGDSRGSRLRVLISETRRRTLWNLGSRSFADVKLLSAPAPEPRACLRQARLPGK